MASELCMVSRCSRSIAWPGDFFALRVAGFVANWDPFTGGSSAHYPPITPGEVERMIRCTSRSLSALSKYQARATELCRNPENGQLSYWRAQCLSSKQYEKDPLAFYREIHKQGVIPHALARLYSSYPDQSPSVQQRIVGLCGQHIHNGNQACFFRDAYSYSGIPFGLFLKGSRSMSAKGLSDMATAYFRQALQELSLMRYLRKKDPSEEVYSVLRPHWEELIRAIEAVHLVTPEVFRLTGRDFLERAVNTMKRIASEEGSPCSFLKRSDSLVSQFFGFVDNYPSYVVRALEEQDLWQGVPFPKVGLPLV